MKISQVLTKLIREFSLYSMGTPTEICCNNLNFLRARWKFYNGNEKYTNIDLMNMKNVNFALQTGTGHITSTV